MSLHARRILTPGASRKRKERDAFLPPTSPRPLVSQTAVSRAVSGTNLINQAATTSSNSKGAEPVSSNRLLAGYMAYEFLTSGTLFGQKFDPARAEAQPVSSAEPRKNNRHNQSLVKPSSGQAEPSGGKLKPQSYAEVANLLKGDGAHLPGIVNPTQLARWIQM